MNKDSELLPISDEFRGDDEALRAELKALIELSDKMAKRGIGVLPRHLLSAAYHRLARRSLPAESESAALLVEARELLTRYRMETPLGHQPAMIANRADAALAKLNAAIGDQP